MDKKRIAYIIGFIIVCIGIGYALYRVFFAPTRQVDTPIETDTGTTGGTFPTITDGTGGSIIDDTDILPDGTLRESADGSGGRLPDGVTLRTTETVASPRSNRLVNLGIQNPSANTTNGARFYNPQDGRFYSVARDGRLEPLSDKVFFNVDTVTWSPKENASIIEYPDGANIYYNFETKQQVTLPKHWEDFSFAPSGEKIASKSMGLALENRWLISSDPDGQNISAIEPMGTNADKVTVDWSPNRQIVALSLTGDALGSDRQQVLFVGQNKENFKGLIVEGRGLQTQWSPDGGKLLHSVYSARSSFKPELWIVGATPDSIGSNRRLLNVNTWAEKCTMADERFAYCGVPVLLDDGSGFAPDLANNVADTLYKIDTQTGLKTIIPLDHETSIGTMFVGDDGEKLYYTSEWEDGLFQVNI